MAGLIRLLHQKWDPPKPETSSFTGRTVLITGATTGLGLEAAKKIACLEPSTLIITARSKDRGEKAKEIIERHVKSTQPSSTNKPPQIHLLLLNMSQFEAVVDFAKEITTQFSTLDTVILNAGTASKTWKTSPSGYEEQLQVNSLSTTLLALLLLPTLLKNATTTSTGTKPHLEIVTSGLARLETLKSMTPYLHRPLHHLNNSLSTTTVSSPRKQYARSKAVMEVNMKRIAALPCVTAGPNPPAVIVNSSCPGLCATDLARDMATTIVVRVLLWIFYAVFGRSAEEGSNTLVSAVTRGVEGLAKMWKNDRYYDAGEFLESVEGKAFADEVWRDTRDCLVRYDSSLDEVMRGSS